MSKCLHVARQYKVEWSNMACFNWKIEEFHALLSSLGVYYTGEPWDDEFEVSKEDWLKGIENLKNYDNLDANQKESIDMALETLEHDRDDVIEIMQEFYDSAEPEWDWIECSFF